MCHYFINTCIVWVYMENLLEKAKLKTLFSKQISNIVMGFETCQVVFLKYPHVGE